MSSSANFGEKHSHFRFHLSTNTLPSRQREETAEKESKSEMILKLSGFPTNDVMTTGWSVHLYITELLQYPLTIIEGTEVTDITSQTSANNQQPKLILEISMDDSSKYLENISHINIQFRFTHY